MPFNEPGRYALAAILRTRVSPLESLDVITQDEDIVAIQVNVVGEPQTGAITGTVTAENTGAPLEGVPVQVIEAANGRPRSTVRTAADGTYIATGLHPGRYLVWANPLQQNYLPEWYDDSSTREGADPVTVTVNETTRDINLALTPGSVISGRVIEDTGTMSVTVPISNVLVTGTSLWPRRAPCRMAPIAWRSCLRGITRCAPGIAPGR